MAHQENINLISQCERLAVLGEAAVLFAHEGANLLNRVALSIELLEGEQTDCPVLMDARYLTPLRNLRQVTEHLIALLQEFRTISATLQYAAYDIQVEQFLSLGLPV